MKITYSPNEENYLGALKDIHELYVKKSAGKVLTPYFFIVSFVAACALSYIAYSLDYQIISSLRFQLATLLLAFALPSNWVLNRIYFKRYNQARMDEIRNSFLSPKDVTLSEEGLTVTSQHANTHIRWTGIDTVYAGNHSLLFFAGDFSLHIPCGAFEGSADNTLEDAIARIESISGMTIKKISG